MAVFPTPGSPTNTGLFFVRRPKIWITRSISRSRPTIGSSLPWAASWVKLVPNSSKVAVFAELPRLLPPEVTVSSPNDLMTSVRS